MQLAAIERLKRPSGEIPPESEGDPDQWWFWTPEWQVGEREVVEAMARGEWGEYCESGEEFLALLERVHREQLAKGE